MQARIQVVRATGHQDRQAIFRLDLLEHDAALVLHVLIEALERSERLFRGEVALVLRDLEQVLPGLEQALLHAHGLTEAERRVDILDAARAEEVLLFGERGFDHVRRAGDDRAARVIDRVLHERWYVREDREEDRVERALLVHVEQQVVEVRLHDLGWEARID
jgi:hypothetical protein